MVNEQYERAKQILLDHKEGHNQLAELLISREVIFAEDVEKIFGKRPWTSRSQELMNEASPNEADEQKQVETAEVKQEETPSLPAPSDNMEEQG